MKSCLLPSKPSGGSTLLLVLWAIMLMSVSVIGLVHHLTRGLEESVEAEKEFRSRLLLESARTISNHPAIHRGDPLLHQRTSSVTSYQIKLGSEGSRLAINQLASNPAQQGFAQRLFEKWGLDSRKAQTLVDSIADWIDADSQSRIQGAERDFYDGLDQPAYPFNRPFKSVEDILRVRGTDEMERVNPGWRDSITLYGDGTIDIHTAPSPILETLFDVTASEVGRLIRARNGPDEIPDTEDDENFQTLAEARSMLDVPEINYQRVASLIVLEHPVRRTECVARAGNLERRLTLLRGGGISLILNE